MPVEPFIGEISLMAFSAINSTFNTVLGPLSQNGIDMPPTGAMINTWESGCKEYTATATGWKTIISDDLVAFNNVLAKNNLPPIKLPSTAMSAPSSCTFAAPAPSSGGRK